VEAIRGPDRGPLCVGVQKKAQRRHEAGSCKRPLLYISVVPILEEIVGY